jgi:acyl-CoA synthetase (AMP-forming)/AMP-acid ligase II/alkylation response protein AidB-like acyl-CoA dehydrogenase/acyl carrier protein
MLWDRAEKIPDSPSFTYLRQGELPEETLTFSQLAEQSQMIACALQDFAQAGDRVLILAPPGLAYIAAFFACSEAGLIATPAYPPRDGKHHNRLDLIVASARPSVVLTTAEAESTVQKWQQGSTLAAMLPIIVVDQLSERSAPRRALTNAHNEIAFLQYTSGSTSAPKGVMVTNANIFANIDQISTAFGGGHGTRGLTWLPPYHDMGLIGCILYPVARGYHVFVAPPSAIIQRPLRWLKAVSDLKIEHTGGPDFAYDLCARRITDDDLESLDLSSWKLAFNGAEPVKWQTLRRFAERFSKAGFSPAALRPCYGLAEATLAVSAAGWGENLNQVDEPLRGDCEVSCGKPLLQDVRIVDLATGKECAEGEEGEIWVSGPNVALGYWENPESSAEIFGAELRGLPEKYLKTGDLGRLIDGSLRVTGRIKEMLIVRGVNYHPHDLEEIAIALDARCQAHGGAVFQIEPTGEVVFVQEVSRDALRTGCLDKLASSIANAVLDSTGLALDEVAIVPPGQIPRTSSGKLQRLQLRNLWGAAEVDIRGTWSRQRKAKMNDDTASKEVGVTTPWALETADWIDDFCEKRVNFSLMDERRTLQPHVILEFGRRGLLGLTAPVGYGGSGSSVTDILYLLRRLGSIDPTLALFTGLTNILGVYPIARHGNARLREQTLPLVASGRMLAAFALTEPAAGSNPLALVGKAQPDGDGSWSLHGTKWYSGVAAWSGVITTFFRDTDPSGGAAVHAFCLPSDRPGIRQGGEAMTMGMRAMIQNAVHFDKVRADKDDLLGSAGQGLSIAQDAMGFGRLAIAAASIGAIEKSLDVAATYASHRRISTGLLVQNPNTRAVFWRMTLAINSLNQLVFGLAKLIDKGETIAPEILAITKVISSEEACAAVDSAVQVLGGRGYLESEILARFLRDVRVLRIFEGPSEALCAFIGAAVMASQTELLRLFRQVFKADAVAQRWQAALEELAKTRAPESDRNAEAMVAGEITCSAVLAAGAFQTCAASANKMIDAALYNGQLRRAAMASAPPASMFFREILDPEKFAATNRPPGYEDWQSRLFEGVNDIPSGIVPVIGNLAPAAPLPDGSQSKLTLHASAAELSSRIVEMLISRSRDERWKELGLGIADRSFTELGLDSIDAAELSVEIEDEFGLTLDPALLWSYPTPSSLALYLAEQRADEGKKVSSSARVAPEAAQNLSDRLRQAARNGSSAHG